MQRPSLAPLVIASVLFAACATTKPSATSPAAAQKSGERQASNSPSPASNNVVGAEPDGAAPARGPIYFEYNSAALSPDGLATLHHLAQWKRAHPEARIRISGHCDDRGTPEYNLALGDQRARTAKDTLVRLGVDARQIEVISRGEEEPAVRGADEEAWSKNRRDEIEIRMSDAKDRV